MVLEDPFADVDPFASDPFSNLPYLSSSDPFDKGFDVSDVTTAGNEAELFRTRAVTIDSSPNVFDDFVGLDGWDNVNKQQSAITEHVDIVQSFACFDEAPNNKDVKSKVGESGASRSVDASQEMGKQLEDDVSIDRRSHVTATSEEANVHNNTDTFESVAQTIAIPPPVSPTQTFSMPSHVRASLAALSVDKTRSTAEIFNALQREASTKGQNGVGFVASGVILRKAVSGNTDIGFTGLDSETPSSSVDPPVSSAIRELHEPKPILATQSSSFDKVLDDFSVRFPTVADADDSAWTSFPLDTFQKSSVDAGWPNSESRESTSDSSVLRDGWSQPLQRSDQITHGANDRSDATQVGVNLFVNYYCFENLLSVAVFSDLYHYTNC